MILQGEGGREIRQKTFLVSDVRLYVKRPNTGYRNDGCPISCPLFVPCSIKYQFTECLQ